LPPPVSPSHIFLPTGQFPCYPLFFFLACLYSVLQRVLPCPSLLLFLPPILSHFFLPKAPATTTLLSIRWISPPSAYSRAMWMPFFLLSFSLFSHVFPGTLPFSVAEDVSAGSVFRQTDISRHFPIFGFTLNQPVIPPVSLLLGWFGETLTPSILTIPLPYFFPPNPYKFCDLPLLPQVIPPPKDCICFFWHCPRMYLVLPSVPSPTGSTSAVWLVVIVKINCGPQLIMLCVLLLCRECREFGPFSVALFYTRLFFKNPSWVRRFFIFVIPLVCFSFVFPSPLVDPALLLMG